MGTGHQSRTETITVRKRGLSEQVKELEKRQVGHMGPEGRKGITGVRYRGSGCSSTGRLSRGRRINKNKIWIKIA